MAVQPLSKQIVCAANKANYEHINRFDSRSNERRKKWTVANKERDVLVRARSLIYVKLEMGHKYRKTNRKLDLDMVK